MIYEFLADGFEVTEALAPLDIIRRANLDISTVSITNNHIVRSSCGVEIKTDLLIEDICLDNRIEAIILPGGMPGATNLRECDDVIKIIENVHNNNGYICAICAAPFILGDLKLLDGKEAICYPGYESHLFGAKISKNNVVCDGNIITAKGAGVSVEFGLEIVKQIVNKTESDRIKASIQCVN